MISDENVRQVFAKVTQLVALFARDFTITQSELDPLVIAKALNTIRTFEINHPFVCERGVVKGSIPEASQDIDVLRRVMTVCYAHTYPNDAASCRMHPVVDDGHLAAYSLGGPDAVETYRGSPRAKFAFDIGTYRAWHAAFHSFADAISAHERLCFTGERKGPGQWKVNGESVRLPARRRKSHGTRSR